ncbi:unnamed protein product [Rotaria sp. Silwood1]|nr:unnamed protein product [Rotaria sp. Silwood1]
MIDEQCARIYQQDYLAHIKQRSISSASNEDMDERYSFNEERRIRPSIPSNEAASSSSVLNIPCVPTPTLASNTYYSTGASRSGIWLMKTASHRRRP